MNSEEDEFRRIEREAKRRAAQDDDTQVYTSEMLLAEAYRCGFEAGAVAEREACAKVCEEHTIPSELANAIRNGAMRDAKLNAGWGSEQQAEPPPEWPLIKNILDEYGLGAISFVAEFKAAQRPWVDLTDGDWEWVADKKETSLDTFAHGAAWTADQLKEKNT